MVVLRGGSDWGCCMTLFFSCWLKVVSRRFWQGSECQTAGVDLSAAHSTRCENVKRARTVPPDHEVVIGVCH